MAQAGSNGSPPVRVSLSVPDCRLAFGEHLRVVGSCAELGGWNAAAAPMLNWSEGDTWTAAVALPPGQHTFKLVIVRQDGSQIWEDGQDRSVQLARTLAARLTCRFGDTASTQLEAGQGGQPSGNLQASWALGCFRTLPFLCLQLPTLFMRCQCRLAGLVALPAVRLPSPRPQRSILPPPCSNLPSDMLCPAPCQPASPPATRTAAAGARCSRRGSGTGCGAAAGRGGPHSAQAAAGGAPGGA